MTHQIKANVKRSVYWRNLRNWYRSVFWLGEVQCEQEEKTAQEKDQEIKDIRPQQTSGSQKLTLEAQHVLSDLRKFCRADQSCVVFNREGVVDTHATAVLEGRREVWLKIIQLLHVSDEQLIHMMHGQHTGGYHNGFTNEFSNEQ